MKQSPRLRDSLVFSFGIAISLVFVWFVFSSIAEAPGSSAVLSKWAIVSGVGMLLVLAFIALAREP